MLRNYYKKWLRFYLDFCRKYNHPTATEESLRQFIKKLQEKNQTPEQRKQVSDAISLYFDLMQKEEIVGAVIAETSNTPPDIEAPLISEESEKKIPLQQMPRTADSKDIPILPRVEEDPCRSVCRNQGKTLFSKDPEVLRTMGKKVPGIHPEQGSSIALAGRCKGIYEISRSYAEGEAVLSAKC